MNAGEFAAGNWEIARLLGKPVPTTAAPAFLVRAMASVGDFVSTFTGQQPSFTPEMAEGLGGSITVTSAKAQRDLGYSIVPLKTMVKDCYDWMVAEGRI